MAALGHTVAMSNEAGDPGRGPADPIPGTDPIPGAVRFSEDGRLEIYGADGWQPLARVSDIDLPPITREVIPTEAAAENDGGDGGGGDGRQERR